jgi:hypothetical protein
MLDFSHYTPPSPSTRMFSRRVTSDDKMTVTFQVGDREFGGSGNLDVSFWVRIPWSDDNHQPAAH